MSRDKRKNVEVVRELLAGQREEDQLTHTQQIYLEDVRFTLGLLLQGLPQATIIERLQEGREADRNVSYSTAWRLIRDTEMLFGPQGEVDKRMKRMIASEMAQMAFQVAYEKRNARSMAAAANAYVKVWGLDRDTIDLPDFSKLETPANILVLADEVAQKLNVLPEGGSINLNQFITNIAQDADTITEQTAEKGD